MPELSVVSSEPIAPQAAPSQANAPAGSGGLSIVSSEPIPSDTGFVAGVMRGAKNIASLPGQLYHAFSTPPQNTEEQALAAASQNIPSQMALGVKRLLFDPQYEQWRKAQEETPQPGDNQWNNADERSHAHMIAALTPLVGPIASNLADRYLSGDKTGALGELLTYTEAAPRAAEAVPAVGKPIVRGTARGINAAMENAPAAGLTVGTGVGSTLGAKIGSESGLPGAAATFGTTGGIAGAAIGYKLGKLIQNLPRVPGERLGMPPTPDTFADLIQQRYGKDIPESDAPIGADLYRQIANAGAGLNDAQIRGVGADLMRAADAPSVAARAAAQARRPAAAAPAPTPAAAPAAPPEASAAPEGAKPPANARPSRNQVSQDVYGAKGYDDLVDTVGEDKAKDLMENHYSTLERIDARAEGRVTKSDQKALSVLGIDSSGMNYDQAQAALGRAKTAAAAPSGVTGQLEASLAETPEQKQPTLADMNAAIDEANLAPKVEKLVRSAVKFYMKKGDVESIKTAQRIIDEARPEPAKPARPSGRRVAQPSQ